MPVRFIARAVQGSGVYNIIANYFGFADFENGADILHVFGLVFERYTLILQEYLAALRNTGDANRFVATFFDDLLRIERHLREHRRFQAIRRRLAVRAPHERRANALHQRLSRRNRRF